MTRKLRRTVRENRVFEKIRTFSPDGRLLIPSCAGQLDSLYWPRGLRRASVASRLLGLRVRIETGAWTFVSLECCVLSGRFICDELITRPEESY
jgi:hypothetical protein